MEENRGGKKRQKRAEVRRRRKLMVLVRLGCSRIWRSGRTWVPVLDSGSEWGGWDRMLMRYLDYYNSLPKVQVALYHTCPQLKPFQMGVDKVNGPSAPVRERPTPQH